MDETVVGFNYQGYGLLLLTLVPEVFLDFSSRMRSRASREAATTSCESDEEREKPLVTLASNLTFMQTTGSGSDPRALIG